MKADHQPASENPDQIDCTPEDHEGPSQARSYDCTFCKKSFSNAQALGGHMNIHRKEKAKLKGAPQDTQHPLNIPCAKNIVKPLELISSQVKSTTKRPWNFSSSEDSSRSPRSRTHEGEVKQLPQVDETVPRNNSPERNSQTVENSQEGLPSSQGEVDLELRLGHEPRESSDTMRARNFF